MTGSTYDIGDCMVKYTYEGDSGTPHYVALNRSPLVMANHIAQELI